MDTALFKIVLTLHILGAAVWTGGHLVLSATFLPRALRERNPEIVRRFEERYERIGLPSLVIQIVTGLWLAHRLLPRWGDWFSMSTIAGTHVTVKLVLLAMTMALAIHARLRLIPNLTERTLPALAAHIIAVTTLAVIFVLVGVGFRTGGLW